MLHDWDGPLVRLPDGCSQQSDKATGWALLWGGAVGWAPQLNGTED